MNDTKKLVCRALTRVLQDSVLARAIDPKSFFMMLNANFEQLFSTDRIDTGPLWDALAPQALEEDLQGLFLSFARAGETKGFQVLLPAEVGALTPEQRVAVLERFDARRPPPALDADDRLSAGEVEGEAPALPLTTADFDPIVSEDARRAMVQAAVVAMTSTAAGRSLDRSTLLYLVDENFGRLYGKDGFDFGLLLAELKRRDDVGDEERFAMVWRFRRELAEQDIAVKTVDIAIPDDAKRRIASDLEGQARAAALSARTPPAPAPPAEAPPAWATSAVEAAPSVPHGEPVPPEGPFAETSPARSHVRPWLRYAFLGGLLVAVGVTAYLLRPDRSLAVAGYPVPLASARLSDGSFQGVLDGPRWWILTPADRKKRFAAFEARLRAEGRLVHAQVRDPAGQLLVTTAQGNRLKPAFFFLHGGPKGAPSPPPAGAPSSPPAGVPAASDRPPGPRAGGPAPTTP